MQAEARPCSTGFTLIELLIALAVLAVLVAIAIPAYSTMLVNQRLTADANTFLTALHLARSEAIKRNSRVVLCKSSGASCAGSGDWEQGWIVFADANNNAQLDVEETLLRRGAGLRDGFAMTGNSPVSAYVSYTPLGLTKKISGAFQAGTITLCPSSTTGGGGRQIVISITGRPRVDRAACA